MIETTRTCNTFLCTIALKSLKNPESFIFKFCTTGLPRAVFLNFEKYFVLLQRSQFKHY